MKDPKQPSHAVQILGSMIVAVIIVIVTIAVVAPRSVAFPISPKSNSPRSTTNGKTGRRN